MDQRGRLHYAGSAFSLSICGGYITQVRVDERYQVLKCLGFAFPPLHQQKCDFTLLSSMLLPTTESTGSVVMPSFIGKKGVRGHFKTASIVSAIDIFTSANKC